MFQGNYEKILEKISKAAGVSKEEIERKVEARRAKLSGLISKEGAAQVIAAELGINFDKEKLKIDELLPGMKKVNTSGKIISLFPVRQFEKNERKGKVANLIIADETSNIKAVLWDVNHIELIEKGKIKHGDVIEIFNASMRDMELHLGSFSEFKLSDEVFANVKEERIAKEKDVFDFKIMESVKTRAFIVQVFEPRFFYVCKECGKKAVSEGESFSCASHGKIVPEKRAIVNLVLDDGSETIRGVLFHESVSSLGLNIEDLEDMERFLLKKHELLGKELFFIGNVRQNKMFNNLELIIDKVEEVDVEGLIKEFESR